MDWLASRLDVATARLTALIDHSTPEESKLELSAREGWDYTITPKIHEFVDALSEHQHTFTQWKDQQDTEGPFEMSTRQEKHAREILSLSPAFAKLRYHLCPSRIPEHKFWRIYFTLLHGVLKRMDEMKQQRDTDSGDTTATTSTSSSTSTPSTSTSTSISTSTSTSTSSSTSHPTPSPTIDFHAEIDRWCGVSNLGRTTSHRLDDEMDSDAEDERDHFKLKSIPAAAASTPSSSRSKGHAHTASASASSPRAPDLDADISVDLGADVDDDALPDEAALEAAVREHGDVDGESLDLDEPIVSTPSLSAAHTPNASIDGLTLTPLHARGGSSVPSTPFSPSNLETSISISTSTPSLLRHSTDDLP